MPVTAAHAALGGAGLLTSLVGVVAYRRKATLPFKVAYALAWPLLGSAAILLLQPAAPEAERTLGAADAARLAQVRALNAGTMAAIQARLWRRAVLPRGRTRGAWPHLRTLRVTVTDAAPLRVWRWAQEQSKLR